MIFSLVSGSGHLDSEEVSDVLISHPQLLGINHDSALDVDLKVCCSPYTEPGRTMKVQDVFDSPTSSFSIRKFLTCDTIHSERAVIGQTRN